VGAERTERSRALQLPHRQSTPECGAGACDALNTHSTTVQFDQVLANRQAEAVALRSHLLTGAPLRTLVELLKHARQVHGCYSLPGVYHLNQDAIAVHPGGDSDAAMLRETSGIGNQVQ